MNSNDKLIKQSFESYKAEKYKGIIFIKCRKCGYPYKIKKLTELWRGFCHGCGIVITADYTILKENTIKIDWLEYEKLVKNKRGD